MFARALVIATALFMPAVAVAQEANTFHDLLVQYRCPVVDRLERIYGTGDPTSAQDRYIVVDIPFIEQSYVQCMFHDSNTKILCEAASGFYATKPGEARTFRQPATAVGALGRLGFSTDDSAGNFQIDLDVASPPDFNAIADFILKSLHDGYGARADTKLHLNAPFAPLPTTKCIPVG
jgi:hypothetical protein